MLQQRWKQVITSRLEVEVEGRNSRDIGRGIGEKVKVEGNKDVVEDQKTTVKT